MSDVNYNPDGPEFYDHAMGRMMKYVMNGPHAGWLVWKHPDGQWVTYRKASPTDIRVIENLVITGKATQ